MQPVDHILEYYRTKLAGVDAADWPHVHLREMVKHYETLNARTQLADQNRAILNAAEASRRENAVFHVAHVADYYRSINRVGRLIWYLRMLQTPVGPRPIDQ